MRVYRAEERKLRQIATSHGFDTPADYLRDHIARTLPKPKPAESESPEVDDVIDEVSVDSAIARAAA